MQNIKKDLSKEEVKKIFLSYKTKIKESSSLKDTILLYENIIKEITSQKDAFVLLVDVKDSTLKVITLNIDIPLGSDIDGILFECYETKISHIINHARRSSIYRQKVDNFIDAKIKDILVVPVFNNDEDENIIAIIWVATQYKSKDKFTQKDVNYLEKLSVALRKNIILSRQNIPLVTIPLKSSKIENNELYYNLNILVVDDSPIILKFIEFVLKSYNTHIITTSNGLDAIEKFKYKKIDIIFIDEIMIGMRGHKAIEIIRGIEIEKGFDSIPIFSITSDTSHQTKEMLLDSGANIVLHKPMETHHIIQAIEEFRILKLK